MARGASWLALAVLACGGLAACPDSAPSEGFDKACLSEGRCDCLSTSDCEDGQICLDGACRWVLVGHDAGHDGGPSGDAGGNDPGGDAGPDPVCLQQPEEGEFLWPCGDDGDCNSGKCLTLDDGSRVCTERCSETCDCGWSCRGVSEPSGIFFYCLPKDERLCEPCIHDTNCPGEPNLCLFVGDVQRCGIDCTTRQCPAGYSCQEVTSVDGVAGRQCAPDSGHCQCTATSEGVLIPCRHDNEFGTCYGQQLCQAGGLLGECDAAVPAAETCDDVDNDCDGFADEGIPPVACDNSDEDGTCSGLLVCTAGGVEVCNAAEPEPEACDNLDNDCDGETDEDFKDDAGVYDQVEHCGGCGESCLNLFAHATEIGCDVAGDEPVCEVISCEPGFVLTQQGVCLPPIDHLCEPCNDHSACGGVLDRCLQVDPTDDRTFCGRDCGPDNVYVTGCPDGYSCQPVEVDGETLEQCLPDNSSCDCLESNAGQAKPCNISNEFGTCYGVATCDPALGWTGCTAATPIEELCNGQDEDCDGIIDDGLGGTPCEKTNEHGTCQGTQVCDGSDLTCAAPDAAPEVCNGLDDDCDGQTDELWATQITDAQGVVSDIVYDLSNDDCGGCGIPCVAVPPAIEVSCDSSGDDPECLVVACEPGYYLHGDKACLPIPSANLCLTCTQDSDCQGPADQCLTYGDGSTACGRDCSEGSIYSIGVLGDAGYCTGVAGEQGCCPAGYVCGADGQCAIGSGDCSCDADGKVRPCESTNAYGTCFGVETCLTGGADPGWQACDALVPAAEVCDGVDNDCDGLVDMGDDSVDTTGLAGYPDCQNVSAACSGSWSCVLGSDMSYQWLCSAREPTGELCNGQDDDCDGEVDEDFAGAGGLWLDLDNCGQCGLDCNQAIAHLAGVPGDVSCQDVNGSPTCVPQQCEAGYVLFPPTGTPSICLAIKGTSCQPCGVDADCGSYGDRCVTVGSDEGSWCAQRCDASAPYPGCTGVADEQGCCPTGFTCRASGSDMLCEPDSGSCQCSLDKAGLTRACTASGGGGETCYGSSVCGDSGGGLYQWGACDLSANVEVCDGADNDCDGQTDEGFQVGGAYTADEHCGQCGKNCALAYSEETQHVFGVCDAAAPGGPSCAIGGCTESDVGGGTPCRSDADCAGDAAGSTCLPWLFQCGQSCSADGDCPGAGVCTAAGSCTIACGSDAACTAAFGQTSSCQGGQCVTHYLWNDLDGLDGNGCECPVAGGLAGDEPEVFTDYPAADAVYVDRDCDGIDGDEDRALFVSSIAGPGGDGSRASPFDTIQAAIGAFDGASHDHILVAIGSYPERIVLKDGVALYGGYSLDFQHRNVPLLPTVIDGPEPDFAGSVTPGTVNASGITSATTVAGFIIQGYDVSASNGPGEATYAVYVSGSSDALRIVNNQIFGGQGGAGSAGVSGAPGNAGGAGADGLVSAECTNQTCSGGQSQPGGAGGANGSCGAAGGCPGMEADASTIQTASNPPAGCSYADGGDEASYSGSDAQYCKYDCNVPSGPQNGPGGSAGGGGGDGSGGAGCSDDDGSVSVGLWQGASGAAGVGGQPGAGGQGGSAGGGVENDKNAGTCTIGNPVGDLGGTGGGGGAGGCGGSGGSPGASGGASFAVFIASGAASTHASVSANLIARGAGGSGGAGGNGGTGGKGGKGGAGGGSGWPAWCAGEGGPGGRGGDGGPGGGAGGGCGGPSFGVAAVGVSPAAYQSANTFTVSVATGGVGGPGGLSLASGAGGAAGQTGASGDAVQY